MNTSSSQTLLNAENDGVGTSVLIIDDSKSCREMIRGALLEAGLFSSYVSAKDGLEGLKLIAGSRTDMVICDMEMPNIGGIRFLQMLSARPELRDIPVILLTGNHDRNLKLMALEKGASDYLTKPVDTAELVARVKIHLKIKKLQDELKAARNHFKELSNIDPLTGLHNRRFFTRILESELDRSSRLKSELSVLLVDVDHFKKVNDRYGHQMGDKVLVTLAETLRKGLRSYDVAARFGGEEFVLILPATSAASAAEVAERLRNEVAEIRFESPLERLKVTASIGLSTFPASDEDGADHLLRRADEALYLAKRNGRNRIEIL